VDQTGDQPIHALKRVHRAPVQIIGKKAETTCQLQLRVYLADRALRDMEKVAVAP